MGENTMLFLRTFLQASTPMITNFITSRIDSGIREKQHNRELQLLNKQEQLLNMQGSKQTTIYPSDIPQIPKFQFKENEDVDELGQRMWNETHRATLQIPDDAKPHEVRNVMRQIETSFRNHPCLECRDHARQNLKKVPLVKGINSKHDAVERLYEFHNEVNNMLEKDEFTRDDFSRQYGYEL